MQGIVNWRLSLVLEERKILKTNFQDSKTSFHLRAWHVCNTDLHCLSCCASFSYKSTKLRFQQQPVQQLIQTLHQQVIPMVPTMHDKLQIFFFQRSYHKESTSVLLLWSGNILNSVKLNLSSSYKMFHSSLL